MLGILSCIDLLKRNNKFRRSYVYKVTDLLANVPTSNTGWLFAISHAATSQYLHKLLNTYVKKKKTPNPPIKYLHYDILNLLKSFFVISENKEITPFGRVLNEVKNLIKKVNKQGTFTCKNAFEKGAALLLKNLLTLDREVDEDFIKIYTSALIALSVDGNFLGIDSVGTISVRVEKALNTFKEFFGENKEKFFQILEKSSQNVFIEADKDPNKPGFLVIYIPEITIKGKNSNVLR